MASVAAAALAVAVALEADTVVAVDSVVDSVVAVDSAAVVDSEVDMVSGDEYDQGRPAKMITEESLLPKIYETL